MINKELKKIQDEIDQYKKENPEASVGELGDTYHSFNDLYRHRTLLLALALNYVPYAWKARTHEDGSMYDGMFVVGAPTPDGMISYHCDNEYWNLFRVPTIPHAPHFDGYTDADVANRIESMLKNGSVRLINKDNIDAIEAIVTNQILPVFGEDLISKAAYIGTSNA